MRLAPSTLKARPPRRRRYVISWRLWMVLITSSVMAHLLLLANLSSIVARVSTTTDDAPIAVELLAEADLNPPSSQARPPVQAPPSVKAATSTRTNPDTATPAPPPANQPDTRSEPGQTIERQTDRLEPTPTSPPATAPINPITPTQQQPEKKPPATQDTPPATTSPTQPEPTEPISSGQRLPTPSDARSVTPGGTEQETPEEPKEQVSVSQNPAPATYSASITNVTLPIGIPNIPENPAKLREGDRSRTFQSLTSGCLLTPDALQSFGQEVVLNIVVDEKGSIYADTEPTVHKTSGNPGYDNLAICVVKRWKFDPAYDTREGARFYQPSDLQISVLINQF